MACSLVDPRGDCGFLPDDIVVDILCRLPLRSLFECKVVCKLWYHLISSTCVTRISSLVLAASSVRGFLFHVLWRSKGITIHLHPNAPKHWPMALFYTVNISKFDGKSCHAEKHDCYQLRDKLSFLWPFYNYLPLQYDEDDMLDYCNGLILCTKLSGPLYFLCNPTTEQCVAIPQPLPADEDSSAALAFDPCKSSHYKIVRVLHSMRNSRCKPLTLDVFSSDTGRWLRHYIPFKLPARFDSCWGKHSVYLDGVLYMMTSSGHLLRLNLDCMSAFVLELPPIRRMDRAGFIGVSDGHVCHGNQSGFEVLIWLLIYCHETRSYKWILKHHINLMSRTANSPLRSHIHDHSSRPKFKFRAINPTSDIIYILTPSRLMHYDIKANDMEVISKMPLGCEIVMNRGTGTLLFHLQCFHILDNFSGGCSKSSEL